ncbi:MAG TPA: VOC family protein [Angustibacter sp.]|nr:VOC family protein [Angustibacter sp.]
MPHLEAITIHSRRPAALAGFWSAVLDLPIDPQDALAIEHGTLGASESVLLGRRDSAHVWIAAAQELAPARGRVHLDVRLDDAADLDRLISLGAVTQWEDPEGRWQVLADPDGNLFCALAARAPKPPPREHRCS